MKLISIDRRKEYVDVLWKLLQERTPEQSISHKRMPSYDEHRQFVAATPYQAWYIIEVDDKPIGSVYLTKAREIGVFIFKEFHGKGYGKEAVNLLMNKWPGYFMANINPANKASIALFAKFNAKHIQNTYEVKLKEEPVK